jgi:hypothetical protein
VDVIAGPADERSGASEVLNYQYGIGWILG